MKPKVQRAQCHSKVACQTVTSKLFKCYQRNSGGYTLLILWSSKFGGLLNHLVTYTRSINALCYKPNVSLTYTHTHTRTHTHTHTYTHTHMHTHSHTHTHTLTHTKHTHTDTHTHTHTKHTHTDTHKYTHKHVYWWSTQDQF